MNNFSYFSKALDEVVDARLDDYVETLEVDKCCSPRKIRKTQKCGITRN